MHLKTGVADGARTHDNRNHNPGLYQLSYSHHKSEIIAETFFSQAPCAAVFGLAALGLGTKISAFILVFNWAM